MSGSVVHIPGTRVAAVEHADGDRIRVVFAPARVVKSEGIPLADASTLWVQGGALEVADAEMQGRAPVLPADVEGGSIETAGIKYVDALPLPLNNPGFAELRLRFGDGRELVVVGTGVTMEMDGNPKYVRHLDPD